MKKLHYYLGGLCLFLALWSNAQLNMTQLGRLDYGPSGSFASDCWGWVDGSGNEFALVGLSDGFSVVDISDPTNPNEVYRLPGVFSVWRDIKTWNDHAYITTEGGGGLVIVDLNSITGINQADTATYQYTEGMFNNAHNLYIDENGVCYIFGTDRGNGGVIMLDLTQDPMAPVELGEYDNFYVHDGMARGDTLYAAHITDGFLAIVDVSDKQNPVVLGTQNTTSNFSHNVWVSDDGDYLYSTDEVNGAYLDQYDISDPSDIRIIDKIQSNPGTNSAPHNTHFIDNYIVTSYYRDGVTVHDVSRPGNMIEVGNFDASPLAGAGFDGTWGAFPYFPSGNVILSDLDSGLFVLGVTYERGCYLEGEVTDAVTNNAINEVEVRILNSSVIDETDLSGEYTSGIATAGTYQVEFSKPGYVTDTADNVVLVNGMLTIQDFQLTPLTPFTFSGQVVEAGTGNPIQNASVILFNEDFSYNFTTDANGNFSDANFIEGTYEIIAGNWGHRTFCETGRFVDATNNSITIMLLRGWYDDFSLDFGWTVTGAATTGIWERGEPDGTVFQGEQANPQFDVTDDCGDLAFVTGNAGGNAANDDVDGGETVITSPVFDLAGMTDPHILYSRWFFAGGGQSDDTLSVFLSNGQQTVLIDRLQPGDNFPVGWFDQDLRILDFISLTNDMRVIVRTADQAPGQGGNLIEAGFDHFRIEEGTEVSIEEIANEANLMAFPNPFVDQLTISYRLPDQLAPAAQLVVFDMSGRVVHQQGLQSQEATVELAPELQAGFYLVEIRNGDRTYAPIKVSKQ